MSELDLSELTRFPGQLAIRAIAPKPITDPLLLAARIADMRWDGYAILDEALELGLRWVVPVRSRAQTIVASIDMFARSARYSWVDMHDLFPPHLLNAAGRVEKYLLFN